MLSDAKQRELYDNYGHAGVDPNSGFQQGGNPFQGGGFNFNQGQQGGFEFQGGGDAEELFDMFFGGGRRRPRGPQRGADLQMSVQLKFEEAVFGCEKDLDLKYQVRTKKGIQVKERQVSVNVPAGVDSGLNLRLSGQGADGDPGAPKGDLIVQLVVDDDDYFERDGTNVHTEAHISLVQAVLGGTIDVRTLRGEVEMKIPKGCQMDTKLVLRRKGIQRVNAGGKGNHIVHLRIKIPEKINSRQEELLREFHEESESCGLGLTGKIAEAAKSTFETFFGKDTPKSKVLKDKEKGQRHKLDEDEKENEDLDEKRQHVS